METLTKNISSVIYKIYIYIYISPLLFIFFSSSFKTNYKSPLISQKKSNNHKLHKSNFSSLILFLSSSTPSSVIYSRKKQV
ncbi:hypothetical protein POPTR_001G399050v4 [Populus trichocarpa]|uniref:Uncharacterized protein n=1 Tax=Populus trichocarpa TaxID=3694 RepID=A0ACC0TNZ6_POPTR|nr:hypothetical protein POPTR_001G399050v4 [Populus trichocarpa]